MIEKVVIVRSASGLRLLKCQLLDADDVVVDELPISGFVVTSDVGRGTASLEMHSHRVTVVDEDD